MNQIKHIVKTQDFSTDFLARYFALTEEMKILNKYGTQNLLKNKKVCLVFYEPSTRTRTSFEKATKNLGGETIIMDNAGKFSSTVKGESLEDSIKIYAQGIDVLVLRSTESGSAEKASKIAEKCKVHFINAGDGSGQHPTQTLLDLYTIAQEFQSKNGKKIFDNLKIAMVGDLKKGRTVRSLSYVLGKYDNVEIYFVSPESCRMGNDVKEYLKENNVKYYEVETLNDTVGKVNFYYMTRVQLERWLPEEEKELINVLKNWNKWVMNKEIVSKIGNAKILHPLPKIRQEFAAEKSMEFSKMFKTRISICSEISRYAEKTPNCIIFKQAENGIWTRMAGLTYLLNPEYLENIHEDFLKKYKAI